VPSGADGRSRALPNASDVRNSVSYTTDRRRVGERDSERPTRPNDELDARIGLRPRRAGANGERCCQRRYTEVHSCRGHPSTLTPQRGAVALNGSLMPSGRGKIRRARDNSPTAAGQDRGPNGRQRVSFADRELTPRAVSERVQGSEHA
jgi:hypothetical protein